MIGVREVIGLNLKIVLVLWFRPIHRQAIVNKTSMKRFVRVRVVSWMFYFLCLSSDCQNQPIAKTSERPLQLLDSAVDIWFYDVYKFVFPQPPFIGAPLFEVNIVQ